MTSMRSQQQPNPFRNGSMDEKRELPSSTSMANSNISSMVSQMTGIIAPPPQQQQHPSQQPQPQPQPQANQLYQQNQQYQQQQQQRQVHQPQQYPSTQITAQQRAQPLNQPVNSHEARKAWRLHGTDNSQVLEDRRNNLRSQSSFSSPTSTSTSPNEGASIQSVRVSAAENRVDITGASYTTYVMEVEPGPCSSKITVEHRYSSFLKLHNYLNAHSIHLRSSFPRRSLAGRLGHWTPSTQWAPRAEHELVGYRKIKLDIWLVELAEVVGRLRMGEERERVLQFFRRGDALPCDAVNEIRGDSGSGGGNRDDGNYLMNYPTAGPSLVAPSYHAACHTSCHTSSPMTLTSPSTFRPLNKPISFTLGSEIRKAAHTLRSMCGTSRDDLVDDSQIPLDLLRNAHGLCFLTVLKAGFLMSGRIGTGLVIARQPDGGWSPPSALGTLGMGWGVLVGGDLTDYLIVLNTKTAVEALGSGKSVNLGAELGIAVGPIGRSATGSVNAKLDKEYTIAPAYSYAHSRGLFAGISLEGSMISPRPDLNAKFYGRVLEPNVLLFGGFRDRPRAALPLYEALDEAMSQPQPRLQQPQRQPMIPPQNHSYCRIPTESLNFGNVHSAVAPPRDWRN